MPERDFDNSTTPSTDGKSFEDFCAGVRIMQLKELFPIQIEPFGWLNEIFDMTFFGTNSLYSAFSNLIIRFSESVNPPLATKLKASSLCRFSGKPVAEFMFIASYEKIWKSLIWLDKWVESSMLHTSAFELWTPSTIWQQWPTAQTAAAAAAYTKSNCFFINSRILEFKLSRTQQELELFKKQKGRPAPWNCIRIARMSFSQLGFTEARR